MLNWEYCSYSEEDKIGEDLYVEFNNKVDE